MSKHGVTPPRRCALLPVQRARKPSVDATLHRRQPAELLRCRDVRESNDMPVIDVHTHNFSHGWLDLLRRHGGQYQLKKRPDGREEIFRGETPVAIPQPGHFDYGLRLRTMDEAGIDLSIVSLTCPNV